MGSKISLRKTNETEHHQKSSKMIVLRKQAEELRQQVITQKPAKLQKKSIVALVVLLFLVSDTPALLITVEPSTVYSYKHHQQKSHTTHTDSTSSTRSTFGSRLICQVIHLGSSLFNPFVGFIAAVLLPCPGS